MTFDDETRRLKTLLADLDARFDAWSPHSAGPMNSALVEQRGYRGAISNREARRA